MPTPPLIRKVRFEVRPWGDEPYPGRELLPYIDNVSLVDLIAGFERAAGYDVPGEYAGIVLDHFNYGDLTGYLMGRPDSAYWAKRGVVALLGCDCGEVGCSPLEARLVAADDTVTWCGFAQPHRPKRDYGDFGPFMFRRSQYERAVREAVVATSSPSRWPGCCRADAGSRAVGGCWEAFTPGSVEVLPTVSARRASIEA